MQAITRHCCDLMAAYGVTGYSQFAGLEFTGAFRTWITRNGRPVVEALYNGLEEAIHYRGEPRALDALHRTALRWLMHYGHPVIVGAEDAWLRWYIELRPVGVGARRWLAARRRWCR